jgi:hypothetical protein
MLLLIPLLAMLAAGAPVNGLRLSLDVAAQSGQAALQLTIENDGPLERKVLLGGMTGRGPIMRPYIGKPFMRVGSASTCSS